MPKVRGNLLLLVGSRTSPTGHVFTYPLPLRLLTHPFRVCLHIPPACSGVLRAAEALAPQAPARGNHCKHSPRLPVREA